MRWGVRRGASWQVALAMLVVYVMWGSVYVAVRVVVTDAPPLVSIGVRYLVAALLLAAVAVRSGGLRALAVDPRMLPGCLLLACLLPVLSNGTVSLAESEGVTAGPAALLSSLTPISIVVLRLLDGQRPPYRTVAGVLVGFAGLGVLLLHGDRAQGFPLGPSLLVVMSANCWALGSFLQPRLHVPVNPFVTASYEMLLGGAILVVAGVVAGEPVTLHYHASTWWVLAYLTLSSTVAFGSYVWLLANAPISLVSTHAYVNPVIAVALAWALLSEAVTSTVAIGGGIVVVAVALVITAEWRRPPRTSAT